MNVVISMIVLFLFANFLKIIKKMDKNIMHIYIILKCVESNFPKGLFSFIYTI